VGGINESDIGLATASGAVVLGFNVRASGRARDAERPASKSAITTSFMTWWMTSRRPCPASWHGTSRNLPRQRQDLEVFNITKVGKVAGCQVTEGNVQRGAKVRLIRDQVVVHEGTLSTLKRFKDEVKEVQVGQECGMAFEGYQDMRVGDVIECFRVEKIQRKLD
jgi:translation initiation factor IF-2